MSNPVALTRRGFFATVPSAVGVSSLLTWMGGWGSGQAQDGRHLHDVRRFGAHGDGQADDTEAIRAAFATARPGDIVYFPPGDYVLTGPILFAVSHVAVVGHPGASTLRQTRPAHVLYGRDVIGVYITGLRIVGTLGRGPLSGRGVLLENASQCVVFQCEFLRIAEDAVKIKPEGRRCSDNTIAGCRFEEWGNMAIILGTTGPDYKAENNFDTVIEDNVFVKRTTMTLGPLSGYGLYLDSPIRCVVRRNRFEFIFGLAINGAGVVDTTIADNIILETGPDGVGGGISVDGQRFKPERVQISGNRVSGIRRGDSAGIKVRDLTEGIVRDNILFDNAGYDLYVVNTSRSVVSGNSASNVLIRATQKTTVAGNRWQDGRRHVWVQESSDLHITGNTIQGMARAGLVLERCADCAVTANLVSGNDAASNDPVAIHIAAGSARTHVVGNSCGGRILDEGARTVLAGPDQSGVRATDRP